MAYRISTIGRAWPRRDIWSYIRILITGVHAMHCKRNVISVGRKLPLRL